MWGLLVGQSTCTCTQAKPNNSGDTCVYGIVIIIVSGKRLGPEEESEESDFSSTVGDTIGLLLEFRQQMATLSFYKNGVKCGRKFNALTGSFYPALAMFYGEVQVTLDPLAIRINS